MFFKGTYRLSEHREESQHALKRSKEVSLRSLGHFQNTLY